MSRQPKTVSLPRCRNSSDIICQLLLGMTSMDWTKCTYRYSLLTILYSIGSQWSCFNASFMWLHVDRPITTHAIAFITCCRLVVVERLTVEDELILSWSSHVTAETDSWICHRDTVWHVEMSYRQRLKAEYVIRSHRIEVYQLLSLQYNRTCENITWLHLR